MKLSELVRYCEEISINCEKCLYKENCEQLTDKLEDISPFGVVELVKEDEDI